MASSVLARPWSTAFRRRPRILGGFTPPRSRRLQSQRRPLSSTTRRITFLTDVEGDRDYLQRFVEQSRVLCFRPTAPTDDFPYDHWIDFDDPSAMFVYGGDVGDQGGSDLYVARQLLSLADRHSHRVHFIAGNRDINKMRLMSELGGESGLAPPHPGAFWLRGTGLEGDPERRNTSLSLDPAERLRWILATTMGSPRAFEHRRWELQQENGHTTNISDEQVVDSYRQCCHPNGGLWQRYLSKACLAVRIGEVLFQHGSLPLTRDVLAAYNNTTESIWDDLTFAMPWLDPGTTASDAGIYNIDDWIGALNQMSNNAVQNWRDYAGVHLIWTQSGYHAEPPYSRLLQYGKKQWIRGDNTYPNPTVVGSSWSNNGMPHRFSPNASAIDQLFVKSTREFFERSGIRLICSGHQPQGDMPNTIRVLLDKEPHSAFILCCDTSYSGDVQWVDNQHQSLGRGASRSGRGMHAVCEVLIELCETTGRLMSVVLHGTLGDGTKYETKDLLCDDPGALCVGSLAPDAYVPLYSPHKDGRWWTRAAFVDGSYLLTAGESFHAWNCLVRAS